MSHTTATGHRAPQRAREGAGGNERLTAIAGAVLLVLFAAEGVTLLWLGRLLYWHYFIGLLIIGPACLKIGSTVYRFARYYTGRGAYVVKGPPAPLLRVLGPFVILTTVAVLGSGVALGFAHSRSYAGIPLLLLHKAAFVCWAGVMSVHVLAYVWRLPALIAADVRRPGARSGLGAVGGRALRWSLAAAALAAGAAAASAGAGLSALWGR